MSSNIKQQLTDFIIETTGLSDDEFDAETPLYSEGYIDSFALTTIISFIEEQENTEVPGDDITLENFDSINKMIDYIGKLTNA